MNNNYCPENYEEGHRGHWEYNPSNTNHSSLDATLVFYLDNSIAARLPCGRNMFFENQQEEDHEGMDKTNEEPKIHKLYICCRRK